MIGLVLPAWSKWAAIAGVAAGLFLGGFVSGKRWVQADWNAERLAMEQEARSEEFWRAQRLQEIQDAAHRQVEQANAAARDADAAAVRLRERIEALRHKGATAAPGGAAAGDPIGMLADVLERADARAGILARYADAARIAGQTCEAAYDALTRHGGE